VKLTRVRQAFVVICSAFFMNANAGNWTAQDNRAADGLATGLTEAGQTVDLSVPSVVNFWATWCAPCVKEIPDLIALGQALEPDVQVVLINVGESTDRINAFFDQNPAADARDRLVLTQGMGLADLQDWKIRGLPTTYLIRDGQLTYQAEGVLQWASPEVQDEINDLLGRP